MSLGLSISFGFDELPPNGETCSVCKEVIRGKMYAPYIQVMDPKEADYLEQRYCERCYLDITKESE